MKSACCTLHRDGMQYTNPVPPTKSHFITMVALGKRRVVSVQIYVMNKQGLSAAKRQCDKPGITAVTLQGMACLIGISEPVVLPKTSHWKLYCHPSWYSTESGGPMYHATSASTSPCRSPLSLLVRSILYLCIRSVRQSDA